MPEVVRIFRISDIASCKINVFLNLRQTSAASGKKKLYKAQKDGEGRGHILQEQNLPWTFLRENESSLGKRILPENEGDGDAKKERSPHASAALTMENFRSKTFGDLLGGSFSAVPKPAFAMKATFWTAPRDLHSEPAARPI